jgi:hypothetical protein
MARCRPALSPNRALNSSGTFQAAGNTDLKGAMGMLAELVETAADASNGTEGIE